MIYTEIIFKISPLLVLTTLLAFFAIIPTQSSIYCQNSWSIHIDNLGTFSSPRVQDITGDGYGDIILGAGRKEFQSSDSAIVAINGLNGETIWTVRAEDQIFGSAIFQDLNLDGIKDIIINGRSAELLAIDGASGLILWKFDKTQNLDKGQKWYNFYNPQFVSDVDMDGHRDILIANGGDVMAEAHDPDRPVGHLLVISAKTGKLIAKAPMPDGRETYMSATAIPTHNNKDYKIVFGTGGETVGGALYATYLSMVLEGDISQSVLLASSNSKGFIAPCVWADINSDDHLDIIANSVDGRILAFDGFVDTSLWTVTIENTEAYASLAVGRYNGDGIPDFFTSFSKGTWPELDWSKQLMIDGRNGEILFKDSLGYLQMTSPVAADITGDGIDEAILQVNYLIYDSLNRKSYYNLIVYFDFEKDALVGLTEVLVGHNIASTPWIGDIDNDGLLDIVYTNSTNLNLTYQFDEFQLNLIKTEIPISGKINWGAYMGTDYNGVYKP